MDERFGGGAGLSEEHSISYTSDLSGSGWGYHEYLISEETVWLRKESPPLPAASLGGRKMARMKRGKKKEGNGEGKRGRERAVRGARRSWRKII